MFVRCTGAPCGVLWVRTLAGGLDMPARSGLLTRHTTRDERLLANALMSASWSVIFALGMGLGGLLAVLPAAVVRLDPPAQLFECAADCPKSRGYVHTLFGDSAPWSLPLATTQPLPCGHPARSTRCRAPCRSSRQRPCAPRGGRLPPR